MASAQSQSYISSEFSFYLKKPYEAFSIYDAARQKKVLCISKSTLTDRVGASTMTPQEIAQVSATNNAELTKLADLRRKWTGWTAYLHPFSSDTPVAVQDLFPEILKAQNTNCISSIMVAKRKQYLALKLSDEADSSYTLVRGKSNTIMVKHEAPLHPAGSSQVCRYFPMGVSGAEYRLRKYLKK